RIDSAGHVMYRNLWPTNRGEGEPDDPEFDRSAEVFGVCAAAGLYRRLMLDDIAIDGEIFDSSFFAYQEDVDVDWRARLRGWRSWYEANAIAMHERGGTGLWFSSAIQRHILKNRILMGIKNDGGPYLYRRLPQRRGGGRPVIQEAGIRAAPERETATVAVVVVSFNVRELLRACLQSVLAAGGIRTELVVVDNASSDRSGDMVAAEFPGVRLVRNPDNRGFSRASNQGILATSAPYVLSLN